MPHLRIHTNIARSKIPPGLGKELCQVVAQTIGKPVEVCSALINPDQLLSWGGNDGDEPCAQVVIMSVGHMGAEENKRHAKAITEKIQSSLGITPTKLCIHFQDAKDFEVGYNGTTVQNLSN
ncbi:unnamed protein product [Orchesella dallaii]|uniref:L-dopachrome isomerase n=1 Tax=Orchesella dallaii TaxID=48710 RepID=A0ABP1S2U4_9HEXA